MMSEYENPTITFYPHESEFDVTPEEQKPALSTNERLMNYNGRLKESLNNGIRFTEVFDTLINTTDLNELFQSIKTLASYQLDDDYLVYPIQYSRADFYLIFINRLLSLNDKETVILMSSEKTGPCIMNFRESMLAADLNSKLILQMSSEHSTLTNGRA